jgi:hypothetical protein
VAFGDQFFGMTSLAERVLPVDSVVTFTENGPSRGPPLKHQFAPHTWLISSHSVELACQFKHPKTPISINMKLCLF